MDTVKKSSPSIGQPSDEWQMCATCATAPWRPSTLSAAGSLANLFRMRVEKQVKPIIGGCGRNSPAWWMRFDPSSLSWKTCPDCSPVVDVPTSSMIWPRWALMRSGVVWLLPTLELRIKDTESSLLPTPAASEYTSNIGGSAGRVGRERYSLTGMARYNKWPTPTASDGRRGALKTASRSNPNSAHHSGTTLVDYVDPDRDGGPLNPAWVEWLMGFPVGWTDLEPSATQSSPQVAEWIGRRIIESIVEI